MTNYTTKAHSKLPKGIYPRPSRSGDGYGVIFTIDGARINLGTFHTLQAAVQAMTEYKMNDLKRVASNMATQTKSEEEVINDIIEDSHDVSTVALWESKLAELPSALLSTDKDTVLSDGTIVPVLIVKNYLNKLFTSFVSLPPTVNQQPTDSDSDSEDTDGDYTDLIEPIIEPPALSFAELMAAEAAAKEASKQEHLQTSDKELP
jgi:hypothetical protein